MTAAGHRSLSPEVIARLTLDAEPWLSCDDCFALIDRYVEAVLDGAAGPAPAMRAHLAGCPACREEARSLLLLVAADAGLDPTSSAGAMRFDP